MGGVGYLRAQSRDSQLRHVPKLIALSIQLSPAHYRLRHPAHPHIERTLNYMQRSYIATVPLNIVVAPAQKGAPEHSVPSI